MLQGTRGTPQGHPWRGPTGRARPRRGRATQDAGRSPGAAAASAGLPSPLSAAAARQLRPAAAELTGQ